MLAKNSDKDGLAGTGSGQTTAHPQSRAATVAAGTSGIQSCFHLIHSSRRALVSLADAICHQPQAKIIVPSRSATRTLRKDSCFML
jgi:hypothetical protein